MKHLKVTSIIVACALGAAAFLFVAASSEQPAPKPTATASKQAPKWELPGLDGKKVQSSEFAGKVIILDFWATWCGPCRMEIPGFIELQKKYEKLGLVVVGVSLDQDGTEVVKAFKEKFGVNYPLVMGDAKVVEAFGGVEAIPTTFIIDRAGRIVNQHVGYADKAEFEREIKPLLKL